MSRLDAKTLETLATRTLDRGGELDLIPAEALAAISAMPVGD